MVKGGGGLKPTLQRTGNEIEAVYRRQVDTVYRLCFSFMKNKWDTEDAVQTTFLKLMASGKTFENETHEKAWLIVTASNTCKNLVKHLERRNLDLSGIQMASMEEPLLDETLQAILTLPDRYKTSLYLYYYEGFSTGEIARMLRRPASTIRNHLKEARAMLKHIIMEENDEKQFAD